MTSVKTDNFSAIYHALAEKRSALPAKLIRLFKQEFYTYALTNQPTASIRVADIDDTRVGDEELILALGKPSTLGLRGLRGLTAEEWYKHIVLHNLEFTADDILENAYPYLFPKNNRLPLNMLLSEATKSFPECESKVIKTFDENLNSTIRKARAKKNIANRSVNGILGDHPTNKLKAMNYIAHLNEEEIDILQLEAYLKQCFSNPTFYKSLTNAEKSEFHRLVRIYDCLKYGNK